MPRYLALLARWLRASRRQIDRLHVSTWALRCLRKVLALAPQAGSPSQIHAPAAPGLDEFPDIPRLRSLHILLAEDHPINQMLAGLLLTQLGHTHASANNGQEALDLLAAGEFDLILMDVMMPLMDGLSAMAEVRAREAGGGKHTPIVVLTAHAMAEDRARFIAAGADGYVAKPISPHALQAELRRVVNLKV